MESFHFSISCFHVVHYQTIQFLSHTLSFRNIKTKTTYKYRERECFFFRRGKPTRTCSVEHSNEMMFILMFLLYFRICLCSPFRVLIRSPGLLLLLVFFHIFSLNISPCRVCYFYFISITLCLFCTHYNEYVMCFSSRSIAFIPSSVEPTIHNPLNTRPHWEKINFAFTANPNNRSAEIINKTKNPNVQIFLYVCVCVKRL